MISTKSQVWSLIEVFNNISINPKIQEQENHPEKIMGSPHLNYVLIPFEGNINPGETQSLKLIFRQQGIQRKNWKVRHLSFKHKWHYRFFYQTILKNGWGRLAFMVKTNKGKKYLLAGREGKNWGYAPPR